MAISREINMKAGISKIDITPLTNVWMDGMIRNHKSEGIHDPLFARALVLSNDKDMTKACVVVSLEVSSITEEDANIVRDIINQKHGIKQDKIIIAATHTHSGPATVGYFNAKEA
ncbi:MAG: neutral/alkaline non-lysosomal ceramidase N-terminal domain-containing protein, partial [Planctomycetota bacterium]